MIVTFGLGAIFGLALANIIFGIADNRRRNRILALIDAAHHHPNPGDLHIEPGDLTVHRIEPGDITPGRVISAETDDDGRIHIVIEPVNHPQP